MTGGRPRIGSLFSGVFGLDMAVEDVFGAETVWCSEIDTGACKVIAHRRPDVTNLGDITAIDWADVPAVDILTGGFPCQDVSMAGRRAGLIRDGEGRTRSGLWGQMLTAITELRPRLVVAENVRGLLSARADGNVEPCPWCLGDDDGEPHMRALGAVLADLAAVGYDAVWVGLRAADVGAPHGRFRVFIFASPADTIGCGWERGGPLQLAGAPVHLAGDGAAPADAPHIGHERAGASRDGWPGPADSGHLPPDISGQSMLRRVETVVCDVDGCCRPHGPGVHSEPSSWGPYAAAVARWEAVLGRPAPDATVPSPRGGRRLNPEFSSWMMGYPEGHITSVPGMKRSDALRCAGNGVVPQQAAEATRRVMSYLKGGW